VKWRIDDVTNKATSHWRALATSPLNMRSPDEAVK